ncbi:unnamed protein product [Ectocarpus fasciculatus]
MEDDMCEASVILGRLGHVKERHGEAMGLMVKSLIDAGARDAVESATSKVRSEYESLKHKLEELYQQSLQDLHAHRLVMEGPTHARLVTGQKDAVGQAEDEIKAVMAKTDQEVLSRQASFLELPDVMRRANKTLKASIKLIGLCLPKASERVSVEGFPPSRLHNAVIVTAPGLSVGHGHRSVDDDTLGARAGLTPTTPQSRRHQQRHQQQQQQRLRQLQLQQQQQQQQEQQQQPTSNPSSCAPSPTGSEEQAAAKASGSQAGEVAAGAAAGRAFPGCCRAPAAWDQEKSDGGRGPADSAPGAPEACSHCACACRADEVWAAYRTLRKRYQALKSQADKEEVRVTAEEQCREMQSELGRQRVKMQAEFDEKKRKMDEDLVKTISEIHAELHGSRGNGGPTAAGRGHKEGAAGAEGLGITQVDLQSLRDIVQASFKESQAVQKESAALREKAAVGEECLHGALQEALSLREEIARRKQHGEVLLARIRVLQGQTSAHVKNSEKRREEGPGSPADSTCDSDSDSEPVSRPGKTGSRHRNASDTHPRRQQKPPPDMDTDDMDTDSDESDDSTAHNHHHQRPAPFPRRFSSNSYDEDGYQSPPSLERERARAGGPPRRYPPSQGTRPGGAPGRHPRPQGTQEASWGGREYRAMHLKREHEDLTHEVYELSARLASSRTTTTTSSSAAAAAAAGLGPSEFERRHMDGGSSFGASAAASDAAAAHWPRRRSQQQEESVAVRAVERVARTTATWRASRGGAHVSSSSSDHRGGDWGPVPQNRARAHPRRPLDYSGSRVRSSSFSEASEDGSDGGYYSPSGGSWQSVGPPKRHSRAADEPPSHHRPQRRPREAERVSTVEGRSMVRGGGGRPWDIDSSLSDEDTGDNGECHPGSVW